MLIMLLSIALEIRAMVKAKKRREISERVLSKEELFRIVIGMRYLKIAGQLLRH